MLTHTLSKTTPFSQSTLQYLTQEVLDGVSLPSERSTLGGIFYDSNYLWLANGPRFQVFKQDGVRIAAWTFGSLLKDPSTEVVCVEEIQRLDGKMPLLAVAMNCCVTWGMICIFDVVGSKVLRTIRMNNKITSLHVVHSGYDASPLPGLLQCFDGILAVGFVGGDVLLMDMYRQTCDETLLGSVADEIRDELNPCELTVLTSKDLSYIESHKRNAINSRRHVAVHLNAVLEKELPHFVLKGPKDEDRIHVNRIEVEVSALHYCPQLCSLLIGYNFGALQLWNILDMSLVYTSPIQEDNLPISFFTVLEPADDPRAACYIWAIYSHKKPIKKCFPIAVLYSFNYHLRELHEGYGYLYQDYSSTSVRFEIDLNLVDNRRTSVKPQGAYCISIAALNKNHNNQAREVQDLSENTSSLCSIAWNVFCSDHEMYTYLIVFDLNQWYKEEMPRIPDWNLCSNYMTQTCLSDLTHKSDTTKLTPCLDICVKPSSLSQFIGVQRLEEHYCPTSLAFECVCLCETDIFVIINQGIQRTLLSHIEDTGPLVLLRPAEIYKKCIQAGLTPIFVDVPDLTETSLECQRDFVLSVALEQQLICWLRKCVSQWANGNYSSAECTLDYLLTWAWQRASVLKLNADKMCVPLFDYSGNRLDSNRQNLLNSSSRQLKNICSFFFYVLDKFKTFLPVLVEIVEQQYETLSKVSVYFEVLQWLLNVGLLPECPLSSFPRPDEDERISAPYPFDSLTEYYNDRRATLNNLDVDRIGSNQNLLFIDNLISVECGISLQKQWKNDGGTGFYPPSSLQALLRTYLIEGVDLNIKHCVIIYVFLDLAMALDQSRYKPIITHLIKFPAVFKVSPSVIKITQAFWQLDHGDFSTAIEQLLDPLVSTQDLKIWHHRTALHALLIQKQFNYALQYLQVRQPPIVSFKDTSLIISLYVGNNLVDEAFYYYEKRKTCDEDVQLLIHFFNECGKHNKLRDFVYRTLNPFEEEAFIKYLKESKYPEANKLLYSYYTLRARYLDALRICNNSCKAINSLEYSNNTKRQSLDDFDVNRKLRALPEISRKLIDVCNNKKQITLWQQLPKSEPLSVFVHTTETNISYKSTMVNASLWKARETWLDMNNEEESERQLEITSSEEIPFLRTPNVTPLMKRISSSIKKHKLNSVDEDIVDKDLAPSPNKRLKLSPRQLLPENRKVNKSNVFNISCATHLVQLDTPVVKRRTSRSSIFSQSSDVCTPHSILKVRNLLKSTDGTSNVLRGESTTPEMLDDIESDQEDMKTVANGRARISFSLTPRRPVSRLIVTFEDSKHLSTSTESENKSQNASKLLGETKSNSSSSDVFCSPNCSLNNSDESRKNVSLDSNDDEHKEIKKTIEHIKPFEEQITNDITYSPKSRRSYKKLSNSPVRSSPRLKDTLSTNNLESASSKVEPRKALRKYLNLNVSNNMPPRTSLIESAYKSTKIISKTLEAEGLEENSMIISNIEEKDTFTIDKDANTSSQVIKHLHNESVNISSKKLIEEDISSKNSSITSDVNSDFDFSFKCSSFKGPQLSESIFASPSSISKNTTDEEESIIDDKIDLSSHAKVNNTVKTPRSKPKARKSLTQKVLVKNAISKMLKDTSNNKDSVCEEKSFKEDSTILDNTTSFEMSLPNISSKAPVLSDSIFQSSVESAEGLSESYESAEGLKKKFENKNEEEDRTEDETKEKSSIVELSDSYKSTVSCQEKVEDQSKQKVSCDNEKKDSAKDFSSEKTNQNKSYRAEKSNRIASNKPNRCGTAENAASYKDQEDCSNNSSNQFGVIDAKMNVFEVSGELNVNYSMYDMQADSEDIYGVGQVQLYTEEDEVLSEENGNESDQHVSEESSTSEETDEDFKKVYVEEPSDQSNSEKEEELKKDSVVIIEIDSTSEDTENSVSSNSSSPKYSERNSNNSDNNVELAQVVDNNISDDESSKSENNSSDNDSSIEEIPEKEYFESIISEDNSVKEKLNMIDDGNSKDGSIENGINSTKNNCQIDDQVVSTDNNLNISTYSTEENPQTDNQQVNTDNNVKVSTNSTEENPQTDNQQVNIDNNVKVSTNSTEKSPHTDDQQVNADNNSTCSPEENSETDNQRVTIIDNNLNISTYSIKDNPQTNDQQVNTDINNLNILKENVLKHDDTDINSEEKLVVSHATLEQSNLSSTNYELEISKNATVQKMPVVLIEPLNLNNFHDNEIKPEKVINSPNEKKLLDSPARHTRSFSVHLRNNSTDERIQTKSTPRRRSVDVRFSAAENNYIKDSIVPTTENKYKPNLRKRSASVDVVQLNSKSEKRKSINDSKKELLNSSKISISNNVANLNEQKDQVASPSIKPRTRSASFSNMSITDENVSKAPKKSLEKKKPKSVLGIENYTANRRLTRRQMSLLQKSSSILEMSIQNNENKEVEDRGPEIETIDPMELLDKTNFQGRADPEEIINSPSSSTTEISVLNEESPEAHTPKKNRQSKTKPSSVKQRLRKNSVDRNSTTSEPVTPVRRRRKNSQDHDKSESESVCSTFSEPVGRITRSRTKSVSSDGSDQSPIKSQIERRMKCKKKLPEIAEENEDQINEDESVTKKGIKRIRSKRKTSEH